jgi:hypothetical protein
MGNGLKVPIAIDSMDLVADRRQKLFPGRRERKT